MTANLKPVDFKAVAAKGCFVYAYLREHDKTPYYVGIASQYQRPTQKHTCPLPVHDGLIVLMRSGLTWEQACDWERLYIKRYGRAQDGGLLKNQTLGGDGTLGLKLSFEQRLKNHKLIDAAERYGVSLEEWAKLTPRQRQKAHIRSKQGTAKRGLVIQNVDLRAGSVKPNRLRATAKKLGISFERWAGFSTQEREAILARFKKGWRGDKLFLPRQKPGCKPANAINAAQAIALRQKGLSLRKIAAELVVTVSQVRKVLSDCPAAA